MSEQLSREQAWPPLPLDAWAESCATLHMWTQIVGKIRLRESAPINHGWHSTLYVTARGLTTSPIPHGLRTFQIDFDFIDHVLVIEVSDGRTARVALEPQTVASFYRRVMDALRGLDIDVHIYARPNEVPDPIPFDQRRRAPRRTTPRRSIASGACSCRAIACSSGFARALSASAVRCIFLGRARPRRHAFLRPHGAGASRRHAQPARSRDARGVSHEVSSCGFWAGGGAIAYPAFYAYAYPEPAGFARRRGRAEPGVLQRRISTSSSCPTTPCGRRPTPTARCSSSFSPLTSPRRIWPSGIAPRSSPPSPETGVRPLRARARARARSGLGGHVPHSHNCGAFWDASTRCHATIDCAAQGPRA